MKLSELAEDHLADHLLGMSHVSEEQEKDAPRNGEELASYTDEDGYTVSIEWGVPVGSHESMGNRRYGTMYLTDPAGKKIRSGYWMNWPEKEWNLSSEKWKQLSLKQRAAIEVKQQATKYASLEDQFESRKRHA